MISLTGTTVSAIRRIASELRPSVLDDLGLIEAIEWQGQQFQARAGIVCQLDSALEKLDLNQDQATAVFRIFQETLTNILRHAKATRVEVAMTDAAGDFFLTISDNGVGITEDEKEGRRSLGLPGMRERASLVGGTIEITGLAGKGTVVKITIPHSIQANK